MNIVDLHVHSTKSDGTFTPTELVDYAIEKGLSAFALTDHDSVAGLQEAIDYAASLKRNASETSMADDSTTSSKRSDLSGRLIPEIIPGIELSTDFNGQEVHIVGLFVDYKKQEFVAKLDDFINSRNNRNIKMCALLNEIGIPITVEAMEQEYPESVITRAHFAHWMVDHGYVKSRSEVFDRYIGNDAPYYVPREKITPIMAVHFLRAHGAVPVLAHPLLYHLSKARLSALVDTLKEAGLMAIEAIYSTHAPADERYVRTLAKEKGLLISGGSDFHGANKPKIDLAVGYGKLFIPEEVLDDIKAAHDAMPENASTVKFTDAQTCAGTLDCADSSRSAIFVDMDGTLLRKDCTISSSMRDAIKEYCEAGNHFVLTSGRPLPAILEIKDNHQIDFDGSELIISYNGAMVYDCQQKKVVHCHKLCSEDIRTIVETADRWGIHVHTYIDETILARFMNDELAYYTSRIHMPIEYVTDLADAASEGSYKVQCIDLKDRDKLEAFRAELLPLIGERVNVFFSSAQYLEFLPKGASKGAALAYVRDYLGLTEDQTYAAGDEENDIPMMKVAGHAIAMANARDEVKAVAEIITRLDNNNDGLAEELAALTHR